MKAGARPLHVFANAGKPIEYYEEGTGEPVLFCHGFPELWYSWRNQIGPVVAAGYRVIVPNMRGYGNSYAPAEPQEYEFQKICADMLALLDHLRIDKVTLVGHDWGGAIVWALAFHHTQRVKRICALNTPYAPYTRLNPAEMLRRRPGKYAYQLYFQEIGAAEKELEHDLTKTFNAVFRSSRDKSETNMMYHTEKALETRSFLGAREVPPSDLLSPEEIAIYVEAYRKTGFRGALNWYRNMEANWKWSAGIADKKIHIPALMITAEDDPVLTPKVAQGLEKYIPHIRYHNILGCGHWTQQEKPQEVNEALLQWLKDPEHDIAGADEDKPEGEAKDTAAPADD